jgi:hypothetical protein
MLELHASTGRERSFEFGAAGLLAADRRASSPAARKTWNWSGSELRSPTFYPFQLPPQRDTLAAQKRSRTDQQDQTTECPHAVSNYYSDQSFLQTCRSFAR